MSNGNGQGAGKTWLEEYPDLRNKYFYGQLVTAHDLHNAQDYLLERIKALSLLLNGPGVVYGLDVADVRRGKTWPDITVDLEAGFAIDGLGRHIVVPSDAEGEEVIFEAPEGKAVKEPQESDVVIFYLEREECRTGKVPSYGSPSPCAETCCYGQVRESYRVTGRVLSAQDAKLIREALLEYYRQVDKDELGIVGDAGIEDVLKLILRYADRYQPSVSAFLENLGEHYRVNERGGVAIWAVPYGANAGVFKKKKEGSAEENLLTLLFRRNVLSNETLAQMVAEHAADYGNPHRTPRSEIVHGKYTLQGTLARLERGKNWVEHVIEVGPLVYADGQPVNRTVTSVSVGWSIRPKITGSYQDCKGEYGNVVEFEVPDSNIGEVMQGSPRDDFFGYYTEWFPDSEAGQLIKSPLSGGFSEYRMLPKEGQESRWISIVPVVPYEEGREQPTLRMYVTEGLSYYYKRINADIIREIGRAIEEKFPQVFGSGTLGEFKRQEFEEAFGESNFLDLDIIIYWSAAVTDRFDMDQAKDATLTQEPLEIFIIPTTHAMRSPE